MVRRGLIWLGGAALLAATGIDFFAVLGRHLGLPLSGSIELMQAAVLVAGSSALVLSLWDQAHARVHLLLDRTGPSLRRMADWLSDFATVLLLLALLAGSGWLALDLWHGHEQSEILGVSWRLMRLFANVALIFSVALLVLRLAGKLRQ